jgi:hypothetical protein
MTEQAKPTEIEPKSYEPMCECGHGLYSHYMCAPKSGRCLTNCGCKEFTPCHKKQEQAVRNYGAENL